jgi:hypothetical protein
VIDGRQEKRGFFINVKTVLPDSGGVIDSVKTFLGSAGRPLYPLGAKTVKMARPPHNSGFHRLLNACATTSTVTCHELMAPNEAAEQSQQAIKLFMGRNTRETVTLLLVVRTKSAIGLQASNISNLTA